MRKAYRKEGRGRRGGFLGAPHVLWVFVDELDAHFERARANGATIVQVIRTHGYRAYVAEDLEGYRWTFAQARTTMRDSLLLGDSL